MKNLVVLLFCIPTLLFCQIQVDKAGNGWDSTVYKALKLISNYSPVHYMLILSNVQKIEFWNEDYSSNNIIEGKGVIVISSQDMKLGSINNVACVLVHESCHLKFLKNGPTLRGYEEEYQCYVTELYFLKRLPFVEPDLIKYVNEQIQLWNIK